MRTYDFAPLPVDHRFRSETEREFLYRGISTRHFKRKFNLADYVTRVKEFDFSRIQFSRTRFQGFEFPKFESLKTQILGIRFPRT